jgi:TPR repeat protein
MGYCYQNGIGISVDCAKAMDWYFKAALQGNSIAQYAVGHLYEIGLGVDCDYQKALFWYSKAEKEYKEVNTRLNDVKNKLKAQTSKG